MQRTLSEHITFIEQKIEAFKSLLQQPGKSRLQLCFAKIPSGSGRRFY
jgi:hypothetical protein